MITISLSPEGSSEKPSGYEISKISKSIASCDTTEKRFVSLIEKGFTWTGIFTDNVRNKENWLNQQLFAADIDSNSLELQDVLSICQRQCIDPFVIHESFSSKPDFRKWRVIFKTELPIVNKNTALGIQIKLAELFGGDPAVCDLARLYYGTNKIVSYSDYDAILDVSELEPLPSASLSSQGYGYFLDDGDFDRNAQENLLKAIAKNNPGRFSLLCDIIKERVDSVRNVSEGSGYESVLRAAARLGKFPELHPESIYLTIEKVVDNTERYIDWQHRHQLRQIVEAGIKYGRKRIFL